MVGRETTFVSKSFIFLRSVAALGGIAIAIGTMVDIGIVFVENIDQHLMDSGPSEDRAAIVKRAAEVAPAVVTSVLTTVVSFLPVFGLTTTELRLFAPLAFTKTFAMGAALFLSLLLLPAAAVVVFRRPPGAVETPARGFRRAWRSMMRTVHLRDWVLLLLGAALCWASVLVGIVVIAVGVFLFGTTAFLGFDKVFGFLPQSVRTSRPVVAVAHALPGFGREYMPSFDEGSYLYMPTTMPHASIGEVIEMLSEMDAAIAQIPEMDRVVGKLGRVESALDPAPGGRGCSEAHRRQDRKRRSGCTKRGELRIRWFLQESGAE